MHRQPASALFLISVLSLVGCEGERRQVPEAALAEPARTKPTQVDTDHSNPAPTVPRILFLGDSLSAGLGVAEDEAFPEVIEQQLCEDGARCLIVNAGVSGDTTAGGLRRLDWLLRQRPDLVVIELGANDGLRGLPNEETENNLRQILERLRAEEIDGLLVGMLIPPNYGPDYTQEFAALYPRLANEFEVPRVPFLLEGVAGDSTLNQADGIHPTVEGHRRLADTVRPALETWLANPNRN